MRDTQGEQGSRGRADAAAPAGRPVQALGTAEPAGRAAGGAVRSWLLLRGDALTTAHSLCPASVDLFYADPPFFSGRPRQTRPAARDASAGGPGAGFDDRWPGGRAAYVPWLIERVAAMREALKPTGSLFLHLDWHAVHAVKVALDDLFGPELFVNEIIWSYRTGGAGQRRLARKHDTILLYARTPEYKFRPLRERSELAHRYGFSNAGVQVDERGPYRLALMRDVWEIPALRGNSPERVAFPTQKPLALLRRIIALATDPGDLVADLFCGSGTAAVAAVAMGRRAVAADIAPAALDLARRRLQRPDANAPQLPRQ